MGLVGANVALWRKLWTHPKVLGGKTIAKEVARRVTLDVLARSEGTRHLEEIVHETIYTEQIRLQDPSAGPSAADDRSFITQLRHDLGGANDAKLRRLLRGIVERYTDEISGHFDHRVYALATHALPPALGALFHGFAREKLFSGRDLFKLDDRLLIEGRTDTLIALSKIGTVVLAPTHVSNLDSVLLGLAIHELGLPPFAYGAGLNLFSSPLIGFFMRNLGAYTVDRKKTDPIYRETLKEYATVLLEHGQHNLFFPGGTRSRSGAVEAQLKKGLLGTTVSAFRHGLDSGARSPRIFIVPCTLTYPLVLEASSLVNEYLRAEGGAHYVDVRDEFEKPRRWLDFVGSLLALDLSIHMRVGEPLDPMGNRVDAEGQSHDERGRLVDPARFLWADGRPVLDAARDAEYTRTLARRLVEAHRRDTVALPTSVLAFVLFERLRGDAKQLDLFRFLRSLGTDSSVATDDVAHDVARLLDELASLETKGLVQMEASLRGARADDVVDHALATFATYHETPVVRREGERIVIGDPNLLFYYRNRLDSFGLFATRSRLPGVDFVIRRSAS